MSDENNGGSLGGFLLGAVLGVAAALLLAPRTGKETRRRIGRWVEDLEEEGKDLFKDSQDLWERGKGEVHRRAEKLKKSVESVTGDLDD